MVTATLPDVTSAYAAYLCDETAMMSEGVLHHIVTPHIRPDGECIELAVRVLDDGRFQVGDMVNSIAYLWTTAVIPELEPTDGIELIARQFGVAIVDNELQVEADAESLGERTYALLEAVRAVSWLGQRIWR